MNKVILMGRLTADPEIRFTKSEPSMKVAQFILAVNRKVKREGDTNNADFFRCISFGKNAEWAEKYLYKGIQILITGHIQTGRYTNSDGQKVYITDVIVEEHEFTQKKPDNMENRPEMDNPEMTDSDGFMNIPDGIDEELPFR